ncbi:hypothetical protein RZS08_59495, partial [Arthrospira platensis SPKY1]|nr:hypothetical protein [Arthrospira platensis SPKY1]
VVSFRLNLARFYEALERELAVLSPEAAMGLGFARMAAGQFLGFDYKTDLLDHMDSGMLIAQENDWEAVRRVMDAAANTDDFEAAMQARLENPTGGTHYLIG